MPSPPRAPRGSAVGGTTDKFRRLSTTAVVLAFLLLLLAGVVRPKEEAARRELHPIAQRQERRARILENVQEALAAYHEKYEAYPDTGGRWWGDCEAFGGRGYDADGYIPGVVPEFLPRLPRDPDARYPYYNAGCVYRSDGKDYKFMLFQTPETFPADSAFADAERPYWAWQVSSEGARNW